VGHVDWEVLWWMLWMGAAGACVGSFGNMLIYRLPRERSLLRPLHSYCPECETPIRWYDNLPLVSYLVLRGRCRYCRRPIPARYPLIEGLCALGFMLIVDAFYVGAVRPDMQSPAAFGITGQVAASWPLLVGHLVMVAALLAIAAMDLEEYYVDVRLTWLIAVVGLTASLANGLGSVRAPPMSLTTAGVTTAAAIGLLVSWSIVQLWRRARPSASRDAAIAGTPGATDEPGAAPSQHSARVGPEVVVAPDEAPTEPPSEFVGTSEVGQVPADDARGAAAPKEEPGEPNPAWGCALAVFGLAIILAWAACVSVGGIERAAWLSAPVRLGLGFAVLFVALVGSSIRSRPADRYIVEAIESERSQARRLALGELIFLLPAALLGIAAWWWLTRGGDQQAGQTLARVVAWPGSGAWQPVQGLLWTVLAMLVAGGVGWAVRIFFTLVLGKEALGLGDVHIMWASAAVVGWVIVVLGFFGGAFLAVVGMLLLVGFKRSRAIPFGPWLALGVLLAVLAREPILLRFQPAIEALGDLLTRAGN